MDLILSRQPPSPPYETLAREHSLSQFFTFYHFYHFCDLGYKNAGTVIWMNLIVLLAFVRCLG